MKAGLDRNRYKPLDPTGSRYRGQLGCWGGRYSHWNVSRPRAGFRYKWINRNEASIRYHVTQGYQVVRPDDPEFKADQADDHLAAANIVQGAANTGGHVLARIPEEQLRAHQQRQQERNRGEIAGATRDFLKGGTSIPEKYSRKAIRYVNSDHNPAY